MQLLACLVSLRGLLFAEGKEALFVIPTLDFSLRVKVLPMEAEPCPAEAVQKKPHTSTYCLVFRQRGNQDKEISINQA